MASSVRRRIVGVVAAGVAGVVVPQAAMASTSPQPGVVSQNAADYTPAVVASVAIPHPHVDALSVGDSMTFAGGKFDTISSASGAGVPRANLVEFTTTTGAVSNTFAPTIAGGQVWALAADPATNSVYVGGDFTTVNGVTRPGLVRLDATTGAIVSTFKAPFKGRVTDLKLTSLGGRQVLVVAGNQGKRLWALDPVTGADTGYFNLLIADALPNAWGGVAVYHFAIDPTSTHLVATGNFQHVNGFARSKFFMLDLGPTGATLDPWYYQGFAKPCSSTAARRIANLQGVDWSPDGTAFDITATGQVPLYKADIWYKRLGDANKPNTTVCDGVGRFSLNDPTKPDWINYTGGDSVWVVSDTGSTGAVYIQGHFKCLDNPDGIASVCTGDKTSGAPAVSRTGIGAIDPSTGLADAWNPGVTSRTGGKALEATTSGLWVGDDSTRFGREQHYGIAFAPLA